MDIVDALCLSVTVAHECSPSCLHGDDNPATYKAHNPLCIPMEFGWTRYTQHFIWFGLWFGLAQYVEFF